SFIASFNDIDGTYIPFDRPGPTHRTDQLTEFLDRYHALRIAVSGRDRSLIARGQKGGSTYEEEHIPPFHSEGNAVGTEIWVLQNDGSYEQDAEWDRILRQDYNFNREGIYTLCTEMLTELPPELKQSNLIFQDRDSKDNVEAHTIKSLDEAAEQPRFLPPQDFKISFYFQGNQATAELMYEQFKKTLDAHGFEKVKIVVSHSEELENGTILYNLDLIPVTKKDAINYMKKTYGVLATVAGDSGNDADMLFNSDAEISIIPYGSKEELVSTIETVKKSAKRIIKETNHILMYEDQNGKVRILLTELERYNGTSEDKGPRSVETLLRAAGRISKHYFDRNGRKVEDSDQ
ncbi:MAG: HAD family hydrolase, partial [Patescibacteria group bacterium]